MLIFQNDQAMLLQSGESFVVNSENHRLLLFCRETT